VRGGTEVELRGLDVLRWYERGVDQKELIDGPALDRIVDDLDVILRSKRETAPKQQ
jgi:hypothetical protein